MNYNLEAPLLARKHSVLGDVPLKRLRSTTGQATPLSQLTLSTEVSEDSVTVNEVKLDGAVDWNVICKEGFEACLVDEEVIKKSTRMLPCGH